MSTENSISIASSAMLVELSISTWTARKLDKRVSAEVDVAKGTKTHAGNYNKNLLAGTGVLENITKYASNARAWHLKQTLPWSDSGLRLLPMTNFLAYKEQLNHLDSNYTALVNKFLIAYPELVSAAAFQLGSLFNRDEYPEPHKIVNKFKFSFNFLPVPMAGDFRIDINEEAKNEIIASCSKLYEERLNNAMRDAWTRLHTCLTHLSERLAPTGGGERKIFRDTLVENTKELIELLGHFNLTHDPKLSQATQDLKQALGAHTADTLRDMEFAREAVKSRVDEILNKFNF
jgi:hypothetical protein